MRQRDIYWASLNLGRGREQQGRRPVVIVSGDALNANLGICIACPISSKIKNYAGCLTLLNNRTNNLPTDSAVLVFQIRALAKERLIKKIGEITISELKKITELLNEILIY